MTNKLILHFDARNTLFVADFNSRLTTEKALNTYISGLVWGTVTDGIWEIGHSDISIDRPDNSFISFYKFMEDVIVKDANDRPKLREKLGKFTQENGIQFAPILSKHLKLLEWTYDYNKYLTLKSADGKLYHYIMPTFFHTIHIMHKRKRDFAIIIRTFGLDIPSILNAIKAFLNGDHPMYPEKLDIHMCNSPYTLTMDVDNDEYVYKFMTSDNGNTKITRNENEIIEHWNSIQGIVAVKDDFNYWSDNNYHYSASKPLWINYRSSELEQVTHHIFFDDCIHPRDSDSIVHLRQMEQPDLCNGSSLDSSPKRSTILNPSETEKYVNINLVQSELLECISNRNYFIDKIDLCERRFAKMCF